MNSSTAIGALAALDVTSASMVSASTGPYRVMSLDMSWSLADLGATSDDGQEFGVAHSDYSDAEIEECLESITAIDKGDKIAQERADRLVRTIGQMTGAPGTGAGLSFNDGKPVKTKLNWHMSIGDTLRVWIRNGSGAVYTTGASVLASGNYWLKDSV